MGRPSMIDVMSDLATSLRNRATCKRRKVGAVVLSDDELFVLGMGYNGCPRGLSNEGCTSEEGNCGCVHAEANAVLKAGWSPGGALITTCMPCDDCAALVINAGIVEVYADDPYRTGHGAHLLLDAGVDVYCQGGKVTHIVIHPDGSHSLETTGGSIPCS
jgi:dCMP deaminase